MMKVRSCETHLQMRGHHMGNYPRSDTSVPVPLISHVYTFAVREQFGARKRDILDLEDQAEDPTERSSEG